MPVWFAFHFAHIHFYGHALNVGGGWLTTAHVAYEEDEKHTTVVLKSEDQGRTWHYLSDVAGPDAVPDAPYGSNEADLLQLADGDLMCVMRVVGHVEDAPLVRAYSGDGGTTWSAVDRLPAGSIAPSLQRLQNGVIALAAGRPGLYLWLSNDPRGESWQPIDLVAHHNAVLDKPHHISLDEGFARLGHFDVGHPSGQITAHMDVLEISPNRLLLAYDRIPIGWDPVPPTSDERNRIYILPVEVEKE